MKLRYSSVLVLAGSILASLAVVSAAPIGTAFTFQGELNENGTPVNDTCDLEFTLWNAASGGGPVGNSPQVISGQSVTDGRFTTSLDFGGGAIAGDARWLEMAVCCPSPCTVQPLSPRQELTPAPHAIRASTGVGGPNALNIEADDVVLGANLKWGTGSHLKRSEGGSMELGPEVSPAAEAPFIDFHHGGGSLQDYSARIQCSGDAELALSTSIAGNLLVLSNDKVGIGTSAPTAKLEIRDGDLRIVDDVPGQGPQIQTWGPDGQEAGTWSAHAGGQIKWITRINDTASGVRYTMTDSEASATRFLIDESGNVGIGTSTPLAKLHVGGISGTDGIMFPDGTLQKTAATGGGGSGFWSSNGNDIHSNNSGNVGIGTTTPNPSRKLEVVTGGGIAVTGISQAGSGWGVYGNATGEGRGVYGEGTDGVGVSGFASAATGVNVGVRGASLSSEGWGVLGLHFATTGIWPGVQGETSSGDVFAAGVRGVASATTGETAGVHGVSESPDGYGVWGTHDAASGMAVRGDAYDATGVNYGVYGRTFSPNGYGGYFDGRGYFSGNVGLGESAPQAKLHIGGTPGVDGIIFPDGTLQTTAGTSDTDDWNLSGNAGTTPGTNFLGTTDNQPLEFHVNAVRALRLEPTAAGFPNIIAGAATNTVTNGVYSATIGGGGSNNATDHFATVSGGFGNLAGDDGGSLDNASGATVSGGQDNAATQTFATVGGGWSNEASAQRSTVSGGANNSATMYASTIAGGQDNQATGEYAHVGGGRSNQVAADYTAVAGGQDNRALAAYATIGGGGPSDNPWTGARIVCDAGPDFGFDCGKCDDGSGQLLGPPCSHDGECESEPAGPICAPDSSVCTLPGVCSSNGFGNRVWDNYGTIAGGSSNQVGGDDGDPASAQFASVGGGGHNIASGSYATIGGGERNIASGYGAAVGGGGINVASGSHSTVAGGKNNAARADFSFAAGFLARVRSSDNGTFVWADNFPIGGQFFESTGPNQFLIDAAGGVGIGTNNPSGFSLAVNGNAAKPGGGSWSVFSDRRLKKNIRTLDGSLQRLLRLRGVSFEYKDSDSRLALPGRQIGMIAQEVEQVFPDWVDEDSDGYKYITVRGLEALIVEALRELRDEKNAQIATLETRLTALELHLETGPAKPSHAGFTFGIATVTAVLAGVGLLGLVTRRRNGRGGAH